MLFSHKRVAGFHLIASVLSNSYGASAHRMRKILFVGDISGMYFFHPRCPGAALKMNDRIYGGEISHHPHQGGKPSDESRKRESGCLAVNMAYPSMDLDLIRTARFSAKQQSSVGDFVHLCIDSIEASVVEFDADIFAEGEYVAVIDCMTFVPEFHGSTFVFRQFPVMKRETWETLGMANPIRGTYQCLRPWRSRVKAHYLSRTGLSKLLSHQRMNPFPEHVPQRLSSLGNHVLSQNGAYLNLCSWHQPDLSNVLADDEDMWGALFCL